MTFLNDVVAGLSAEQKALPCKYFYDEQGSYLFTQICACEEYYLPEAETEILRDKGADILDFLGQQTHLIEFGSGEGVKTEILLSHVHHNIACYTPIDISSEILEQSVENLAHKFPDLKVDPICVDYTTDFEVDFQADKQRVIFFPGSTIGNFNDDEAKCFLAHMRQVAGDKGGLLIGVDLVKDKDTLESAYNDADNITAEFNKNVLARINKELGANIDLENFSYLSYFNSNESRIESYLVSQKQQQIQVQDYAFNFAENEQIHTEYSYKYDTKKFTTTLMSVGFDVQHIWMDKKQRFALFACRSF